MSVLPEQLHAAVTSHSATFSPLYAGYLSDHGPMAALALYGLTEDANQATAYLTDYQQRLHPLDTAPDAYRVHLSNYRDAVSERGARAVLADKLPDLVSGWVKDAYHPLIRIAYGCEFAVDAEVAAGLAYLHWCGPDPIMQSLGESAIVNGSINALFTQMADCAVGISPTRNFNQCLEMVLAQPAFKTAAASVPDQLRTFSVTALQVFASTHNFFALHLVTGAHAFRVLQPFTGAHGDLLFGLGLLAGYAAVGAPDYDDRAAIETTVPSDWLPAIGTDEHDIKLAYSASRQAQYFSDSRYVAAAIGYLGR
ncbi:MAG: questin oxidase family protein [Pseudomonadales bacterium]